MYDAVFTAYEVTCWLGFSISFSVDTAFSFSCLILQCQWVSLYLCVRVCVLGNNSIWLLWYILSLSVCLSVCPSHLSVWMNCFIHFCSHGDAAPSERHSAQVTHSHLGNEIVSTHHQTTFRTTEIKSDLKGLTWWTVRLAKDGKRRTYTHSCGCTQTHTRTYMISHSYFLCLKITHK